MISFDDKIYVLDGAMGTMIQRHSLTEHDYRGGVFADWEKELRGEWKDFPHWGDLRCRVRLKLRFLNWKQSVKRLLLR